MVTFSDGSTDILLTNQADINGRKVDVFKGKVLSTGYKAVFIPRDDAGDNPEETIVFKSSKAGGCTRFSVDLENSGETECWNNAPKPTVKDDVIRDRHLDKTSRW